jgi:hypothetical protein
VPFIGRNALSDLTSSRSDLCIVGLLKEAAARTVSAGDSSLAGIAHPREIRTLKSQRCKLLLSPFEFLNYTKTAKYEALEKNALSEPRMPALDNLKYSRDSRKAPLYWQIFGRSIDGEIGVRVSLAEGEELGSNLLQVLHRRPTELGGLGWVAGALPAPSLRIEGRETAILPRRRPLAAKIRAGCATTSKLWPLPRSADRRPLAQLKGGP